MSKQTVKPIRRVRTEEAKAIRRRTGTNPFQAKRFEVAPYSYAPTVTCSPTLDNLLLVEYGNPIKF